MTGVSYRRRLGELVVRLGFALLRLAADPERNEAAGTERRVNTEPLAAERRVGGGGDRHHQPRFLCLVLDDRAGFAGPALPDVGPAILVGAERRRQSWRREDDAVRVGDVGTLHRECGGRAALYSVRA